MRDVQLCVDGKAYGGWKSVRIVRSIEQLASSFVLDITEQWVGQDDRFPVAEGADCSIAIDGNRVLTGYVDTVPRSYGPAAHNIGVNGRSTTGDLVDCSAIYKTGQWGSATLLKIAKDLCAPFGVVVKADAPVGAAFKSFSIQDGETVHECIERAARMRGVLLTTASNGDLAIVRAGNGRINTTLKYGVNVKHGNSTGSMKGRHSKYIVKGQSPGSDDFSGKKANQQRAEAADQAVARYRPLIVMAEDAATAQSLRDRAAWERNTRAGKSQRASYKVQGWEHDDGLWEPNKMVPVWDPVLMIDAELLLVSVALVISESDGEIAELELTGAGAFGVKPLPAPKPKSKSKGLLDMLGGKF